MYPFYFAISENSDTFALPIGRPDLPVPLSALIRQPLQPVRPVPVKPSRPTGNETHNQPGWRNR